jgi:acetylornithine/succinyldiaminopimelate/putrescine aminotransferase
MTETSPYLTLSLLRAHHWDLTDEERLRIRARTGRPFETVELEVVADDGRPVPADDRTVGEIRVRGETVSPGYWNDPDETAAAFRGGWLYTGGALKLAHRATGRRVFVHTKGAFHGRTLGALQVMGAAKHREPYAALIPEQVQVPFDDLAAAQKAIDESVAAFIVEPVQGEGGVNVPSEAYLRGLRERCDATGALLIFDEVQTGMGRTGKLFAAEHARVDPDIMTLGKGLGGGFPVAAFLTTEAVAKTVSLGDHGTTYGGNPLACAAANAVFDVLEEEKLVARAAELGARLQQKLAAFAEAKPELASGARGLGLLQALVLRDAERAATLPARALERGVVVNVTAANVVRFFPALNVPEDDLWPAVETILALVTP